MKGLIQVLSQEDTDLIVDFEKKKLIDDVPDEVEREFASWNARWRPEALQHYLRIGWSFGVWEGEDRSTPLSGYFLGQPLLFFQGLAQTLWVEHISSADEKLDLEIAELAIRAGKDKHFQKVLFDPAINLNWQQLPFKSELNREGWTEVKTTKI